MKLALWIAASALLAAGAGAWTLRRLWNGPWRVLADAVDAMEDW